MYHGAQDNRVTSKVPFSPSSKLPLPFMGSVREIAHSERIDISGTTFLRSDIVSDTDVPSAKIKSHSVSDPRISSQEHPLFVQLQTLKDMSILRNGWLDLVKRSLEPNVFYEPAFVEAAGLHLPIGRFLSFVTVWAHKPEDSLIEKRKPEELLGLFPVFWPKRGWVPHSIKGWSTPFSPLGTPLIDSARGYDVVVAYLNWLSERGASCVSVMFPALDQKGAFAHLLEKVIHDTGRTLHRQGEHHRAAFINTPEKTPIEPSPAPHHKKMKELSRQKRRLAELGELTTERVTDGKDIRDAFEHFLALEASGWKGRNQTSLLQDPATSSFSRSFIRMLARQGNCRIDVMRLKDEVFAVGVLLESGSQSWYWKTAYDERFAKYSPGVQLTLELTQRQKMRSRIFRTDSCAIENHPMIDGLWEDRVSIADWIVSTHSGGSARATAVRLGAKGKNRLRTLAKNAYRGLRQRTTSGTK
jgi:hypothetical protein